jgi:hypothetical protein
MRLALTALMTSLVLSASALAGATQAPNVVGVLIRPPAVGCYPGEPCDPVPYGLALAFSRDGRVVARVRVGAIGRFALHLAPGRYAVRATPVPEARTLSPSRIQVPAQGILRLRLQFR